MEINVEGKNKKYAELVRKCYCGPSSDFITFLLFKFIYVYLNKSDHSLAINMNKFSGDSLMHLEIFGKLITLLGEKPEINIEKNIEQLFLDDKTKLLEMSIRLTKQKIILYTNNLNIIEDHYIKEILERFIVEERKNLKILELLHLKNKNTKL